MVNPAAFVMGMEPIPPGGFVGMNDSARFNAGADECHGIGLMRDNDGKDATAALASNYQRLPTPGCFLICPLVSAVRLFVGLPRVTTVICAVDLDLAG